MNTAEAEAQPVPTRPLRRRRVMRAALWATVGVLCVAVLDVVLGLGYHTSTAASVVVTRPHDGATVAELLIVFPGYASDGTVTSRAFAPHLADGQAMVVLNYAQRGVDDDAIYRLVIDRVKELAPQRIRVLGGSMGGVVATRFLSRYDQSPLRDVFGDVVLVLDTVPSGPQNIRRPQWMFGVSTWYRGGPISSAAWALVSQFGARPPAEEGADPAVIDLGERRNAWIGVPALSTQGAYLATFSAAEIPAIRDVVARATYLQAASPEDDPLVRVSESVADWREALPGLRVQTIATRDGSWHLPWTYRPGETLSAVNSA